VLHNHPPYGNIWASLNRVPPLLDQTGGNGGGRAVSVSEYEGALTDENRAKSLATAYGDADMAILAHHGVLVTAPDLGLLLVRALCFEWRCQKAYEVACTGLPFEEIPDATAEELGTHAAGYGALLLEAYGRLELIRDRSVLDE
jgi:ribulose-5-phosphate 4-epimerase/fuculose-1-phosphate aldolase